MDAGTNDVQLRNTKEKENQRFNDSLFQTAERRPYARQRLKA